MSSESEYHGEEIFQMFTPCEQVELRRGNRTEEINNKLGIMSYRQFQFETNFTYFHAFLHTIPGCLDPYCLVQSTYRQFTVMKCFVLRERMTVKPINIEITPEGYIFYEDNLIAL